MNIFAMLDQEMIKRELEKAYELQYAKDKADFPLHYCNDFSEFTNLFEALSSEEKAAAVVKPDRHGNNLFHSCLMLSGDQKHLTVQKCLDVLAGSDEKRDALLHKNNNGDSPLSYAAKHKKWSVLRFVLEQLPDADKNIAILATDKDGNNLIDLALKAMQFDEKKGEPDSTHDSTFEMLLFLLSTLPSGVNKDEYIMGKSDQGKFSKLVDDWYPLMYLVKYYKSAELQAVPYNKDSEERINSIDDSRIKVLIKILSFLSSDQARDQAIMQECNNGKLLDKARKNRSPKMFSALLSALSSPEVRDEAIIIGNGPGLGSLASRVIQSNSLKMVEIVLNALSTQKVRDELILNPVAPEERQLLSHISFLNSCSDDHKFWGNQTKAQRLKRASDELKALIDKKKSLERTPFLFAVKRSLPILKLVLDAMSHAAREKACKDLEVSDHYGKSTNLLQYLASEKKFDTLDLILSYKVLDPVHYPFDYMWQHFLNTAQSESERHADFECCIVYLKNTDNPDDRYQKIVKNEMLSYAIDINRFDFLEKLLSILPAEKKDEAIFAKGNYLNRNSLYWAAKVAKKNKDERYLKLLLETISDQVALKKALTEKDDKSKSALDLYPEVKDMIEATTGLPAKIKKLKENLEALKQKLQALQKGLADLAGALKVSGAVS